MLRLICEQLQLHEQSKTIFPGGKVEMSASEKSAGISKKQDKKDIQVGGMIRPLDWWKALKNTIIF